MERVTQRKRPSSRIDLGISILVHSVVFAVVFLFAAREGLVGKKLKAFAVVLVPKEKKAEEPKPPEPKPEPPRIEEPKLAQVPPVAARPQNVQAPPATPAPAAAPPAAALPSFSFSDGAKIVQTSSDPVVLYKSAVENALRARWTRPENIEDSAFVAEVEVSIDPAGRLTGRDWKTTSGNKRWDDSVKRAVEQVNAINRPPPRRFPEKFTVRFDVQAEASEPLGQP